MSKIISGLISNSVTTNTIVTTTNDPVEFETIEMKGDILNGTLSLTTTFIGLGMIMTYDNTTDFEQDLSSNNLTITNNNSVAVGTDTTPRDRFATLDGATNYFSITGTDADPINSGTLMNTTNITIGCWFRAGSNATSGILHIIEIQSVTGRMLLGIYGDGSPLAGQLVYLSDFPANLLFTTDNAYNDGNWHHVVFVVGNSTVGRSSGNQIFVDGSPVTALDYFFGSPASTDIIQINTTVSTEYSFGSSFGTQSFYIGDLDDVFISAHAYTAPEVSSLYTTTLTNKTTTIVGAGQNITTQTGNDIVLTNGTNTTTITPLGITTTSYTICSQRNTSFNLFDADVGDIIFRGRDLLVHFTFSGYSTVATSRLWRFQYSSDGGFSWTDLLSANFVFNQTNVHVPLILTQKQNIPNGTFVNKWRISSSAIHDSNDYLTVEILEI